jgi:hypothetical protein
MRMLPKRASAGITGAAVRLSAGAILL